ncbi:MAG: hypothetical protein WC951_10975 [Bacteroidales bacterium]
MAAIGGYFELELPKGEEYHKSALRLNLGRNAFEYILRAKQYKKVYLPYYTCDVMLEPIEKLGLKVEFYHIDENLLPLFDYSKVKITEVFVYTNYFGICDNNVDKVAQQCKNLIVDNSQAFYSKPLTGIDTFYSLRKFFGVPDGAYLYTDTLLDDGFETDISYQRFEHLLGRIDKGAEEFYAAFVSNDDSLMNQPIKKMSKLTQRLLSSIDYNSVAESRKQNFEYLNSKLSSTNLLSLNLSSNSVPLVYPYFFDSGAELKKKLIENKIFVATYWQNVLEWTSENDFEYKLAKCLLPLPVDQRYESNNLKEIELLVL